MTGTRRRDIFNFIEVVLLILFLALSLHQRDQARAQVDKLRARVHELETTGRHGSSRVPYDFGRTELTSNQLEGL